MFECVYECVQRYDAHIVKKVIILYLICVNISFLCVPYDKEGIFYFTSILASAFLAVFLVAILWELMGEGIALHGYCRGYNLLCSNCLSRYYVCN